MRTFSRTRRSPGHRPTRRNRPTSPRKGGPRMRLPKTAHTSRPWRIHEFTEDFELEDAWELPIPGGPDDLERLVQWFTTPPRGSVSRPRALRPPLEARGAVRLGQTRVRRRRTGALAA